MGGEGNLIVCILTTPLTCLSPISLALLRNPYFLRHNDIGIRPINNCTMASKCSSERKSCLSLKLNQQLKMMKLIVEGLLKAKKGWKIDFLFQTVKLWMQRKSSLGKLKCYSSEHTNDKKAKQPYCWYGESFSDLYRSNQPQHFLRAKTNPEQSSNSLQFNDGWYRWGNCKRKVWSQQSLVHKV